jgi:hypothetical protein
VSWSRLHSPSDARAPSARAERRTDHPRGSGHLHQRRLRLHRAAGVLRRPRRQAVSIGFLHEYILGNYRRLYARSLAAGVNHFNQALIVENLLATGRDATPEQRREEAG